MADGCWTGAVVLLAAVVANLGRDPWEGVRCVEGCLRAARVGSDRCADCHVTRGEWVRVDGAWVWL